MVNRNIRILEMYRKIFHNEGAPYFSFIAYKTNFVVCLMIKLYFVFLLLASMKCQKYWKLRTEELHFTLKLEKCISLILNQ